MAFNEVCDFGIEGFRKIDVAGVTSSLNDKGLYVRHITK